MLLLDARHEGYDDWKGISTAEVTKYCNHIRGKYNDDKKLMIMEVIEYLGNAFKEQHKFLKKSNIPMIMVLSKLALENNIEAEKFKVFVDSFSNSVCVDYDENTGSGNVKRAKTEGRLLAIANTFADYFDLEEVNILSVDGTSSAGTDSADSSQGYANPTENAELDSEEVSVDEPVEDADDFSEADTEEEIATDEDTASEEGEGYGEED